MLYVSFLIFLFSLLYFPPSCSHCFFFFHSFGLFAPFLSHPVISLHCSHQSIYAYFCHVLRSPLTLPFPLSFVSPCFSLVFFSIVVLLSRHPNSLCLSLPCKSLFFFFCQQWSCCPFLQTESPPSSLSPCLRSLFFLIVLFQWQGGAGGLAPHYCCRHCWAMMVAVCACVWMGGL